MRLTDISVRALKAPGRGQKTHFDDTLTGFAVRVSQGGTKTFVLMHGATRKLTTIGRVGIITLGQARDKARRILAEKTLGMTDRPSLTLEEARELFYASCENRIRPRTLQDYKRLLNRHLAAFTSRPVATLTSHEMAEAIDDLKDTPVEQNHAFAAARTLFRFCVRRGLIGRSPLEGMNLPARIRTRDRVLTDNELVAVIRAANEIGYPFGTIVLLLIYTGQRKGEIALLDWSWIGKETITIPKDVAKNHREHTVPYGDPVRAILSTVPRTEGRLFTVYNWDAKTDLLRKRAAIAHFTLHDLRRTYASGMAALSVPPHVVEKLLNHVTGTVSGVAAIYNRYSYQSEMRQAVDAWEHHLSVLISRAH